MRRSYAVGSKILHARNYSDGKISVIEEALGALDTKRLHYLQRRRIKMLGK